MRLIVLLLLAAVTASAQTPQELLRLAQDAYKDPNGYEIHGKGVVQPAGTSWRITFDLTIAALATPRTVPRPPGMPVSPIGNLHYEHVGDGIDPQPNSLMLPGLVFAFWESLAEETTAVTDVGTETLPLNGVPCACRVLKVDYKTREGSPPRPPVTYSICGDKHLVLKKTIVHSTGRKMSDPAALWTLIYDAAKFGEAPPQWLADLKPPPPFAARGEWLGRTAPEFTLPDLNGAAVKLSSMRGKVLLLDFWSITCGPCLRAMPGVEAAVARHKGEVTLWGVSFDAPEADTKWLGQHGQSLYTLTDKDFAVSDRYKVQGIPALVLIDRTGVIRNYWQGEVPQAELDAALNKAVGR